MSSVRTQAPKTITVILSVILVILGHFGGEIAPEIAQYGTWLALAGFVLLLLGVYVKGL